MRRFLFLGKVLFMKRDGLIFVSFLLVGFAVFFNGLSGDFVHDDILVLSHSFLSQPSKVFNFFGESYFEDFRQAGLYRPLTQISFAFNFLFSKSPFGFHLVNVLLHIANSFLIYLFLKKLVGNLRLSLVASLLFLVLPIHVEAVTSIVGRAELLSFFFGMLTLLLWLAPLEAARARSVSLPLMGSAMTLFLAFLSKETAVAIPAIVLLSRYYKKRGVARVGDPHRAQIAIEHYGGQGEGSRETGIASDERQDPEFWKWFIYYLIVFGLYFSMRIAVLGQYAFKTKVEFIFNPLAYAYFFERFWTALKVLCLYIWKIFVPYRLSADYSYDQIPVVTNLFSSPLALIGLAFLGLMLWVSYRILWGRKYSVLDWVLIFFFLPFLVISNLIFPTGTIMAERLMYFPSVGMLIVLAAAIDSAIKQSSKLSKQLGWAALLILVVLYSFLTINRNQVWANRETLLTDIFKKSPNSIVAKTEYGILVLNRDKELSRNLSLEVYEKYPDYVQNLNLRAAIAIQDSNFREAENFLERALELRSKHQNTLQNLSRVYFTLGKYQKAEETLKVLVSEYGGKGNVIFYALVQAKNGHFDQARQTLYSFFGSEVKDESALKVLRGEFKELESFYTFGK